jgi:hypothetical protein
MKKKILSPIAIEANGCGIMIKETKNKVTKTKI